ncbi:MAG: AAA family ATPase [Clostridiales bacterium]|jgi:transitional endoplasmic reticulum ATPase|nr:AAA family ATPase [Clostridiales bacterium]
MNEIKQILQKNFLIDDKYTVKFFIKKGSSAETYRVKGKDDKLYFLKLFNYTLLHHSAFDAAGNLLETELLKNIRHPNIVSYKDSGELIHENRKYVFSVSDFIVGETLAQQMARKPVSLWYDVKQFMLHVLQGLDYLHNLQHPVIHNAITPENIMLDLSDNDFTQAKIIDFGYARLFHQSVKVYNREGLNLNYVASECISAGAFSPQSDLFSAGAVMYHLLFGMPPWYSDISKFRSERENTEKIILEAREKPLAFPNVADRIVDFDDSILDILGKALQQNTENRFQSAQQFIQALNGEMEIVSVNIPAKERENSPVKPTQKKGKGFAAIAGMQQLKDRLKNDVIDVIENPEEYKRHNLGLPNGMLLYGPPGCGKTFFAERFAEEAGYYFIKVVSSDIASIYIHGTQEKIGKLFKEAREKAPTILYFDELDAMTPKREHAHNQSQSGEVNEFLSQLDNIGESGVFVIGSTNKPNLIDEAVLRAGRLEKWFYIPPPDFEARKAMFELYLKDRPLDFGIDYERLATLTENYVSSDIKLLIDEASRKTIRDKAKRISMETLEFIIKNQKPTISLTELNKYEEIRKET